MGVPSNYDRICINEPMRENLFGGITRKKTYCRCGEVEDLPAEGMSEVFQLPIVGSSLDSCLRSFVEPEEIEKRCRKEDCNFQKKMQVLNFLKKPQVLIIQIKRFSYDFKEE